MPNGILLLNKPEGLRSTDCVARVKRVLKDKVGHAGTLDSTACGLLVILVGSATRLSEKIMAMPKHYRTMIKLGSETDTCDASGEMILSGDAGGITEEKIDKILSRFEGEIMQVPPEISAIKIGGKPAHKIARAGKRDFLEPRPVIVYSIKRTSALADGCFEIEVKCGKGTYIRSIARDVGRALGCGAHVVRLERLSVGDFLLAKAYSIDEVSEEKLLLGVI